MKLQTLYCWGAVLVCLALGPALRAQSLTKTPPAAAGPGRGLPKTRTPAGADSASANPTTEDSVLSSLVVDEKRKLMPGDKLSFQVTEDHEPTPKELFVADSGEVDFPYVGRVNAAGKTCKQLAEELKELLEKDYYHRATVVVGLDHAVRFLGRVYVTGQVRQQGGIDIPQGEVFTVGKAILRAGGFSDFAQRKKVKLIRSGKDPSAPKTVMELNMVEVLEDGKTEKDVTVQPDDFIVVPSKAINF